MLTIDRTLYSNSADLLAQANQTLATVASSLFDALSDASVSAGEGDGARTWCRSYEQSAGAVTAEISQLIDAFGSAATLLDASGHNHVRAEAAAAPYGLSFEAPTRLQLVGVSLSGIPTMYGGNSGEPWGWSLIADRLGGFAWPGADIDRIRALATAWHAAADSLDTATYFPALANGYLDTMDSPELPAAIEVCERLTDVCTALGGDCKALGDACTSYADAVADARTQVKHAFKELLGAAGIGAGVSIGAALLSGGLSTLLEGALGDFLEGTIAGTYINRIIAALDTLADVLAALNPATAISDAQGTQSTWLNTVASARPVLAAVEADTRVLATELGGVLPGGGAAGGGARYSVTKEDMEHWEKTTKSHTERKHCNKTYQDLLKRLSEEKNKSHVSTFDNLAQAVSAVNSALLAEQQQVTAWMSKEDSALRIQTELAKATGTVVSRSGDSVPGHRVIVVLMKDARQPNGWRVHTAYLAR